MREGRLLGAVVGLAVGMSILPAPAQAHETGYYSVPYSDTLYHHLHDAGGDSTIQASFELWQREGSPTPRPAPVDYVKVGWSPTIFAVHFFGTPAATWTWHELSYAEWTRAGRPAARVVEGVPRGQFITWETSSEIFASLDGGLHKLTYSQWVASGSPAPHVNAGGFYRYPWHQAIGMIGGGPTDPGIQLSYEYWARLGFPTPRVVHHVQGERVWKAKGSPHIFLDSPITGPGLELTYEQWTALGRPAPVVR